MDQVTWQVINRQHWPTWLLWPLIIVMLSACVFNTAVRMSRDGRPAVSDPEPAR